MRVTGNSQRGGFDLGPPPPRRGECVSESFFLVKSYRRNADNSRFARIAHLREHATHWPQAGSDVKHRASQTRRRAEHKSSACKIGETHEPSARLCGAAWQRRLGAAILAETIFFA